MARISKTLTIVCLFLLLPISFASSFASARGQGNCMPDQESIRIKAFAQALDRVKDTRAWGSYGIFNKSLLLIDSDSSDKCGLLIQGASNQRLEFPFSFRPSNGVYAFYYDSPDSKYVFERKDFWEFLNSFTKKDLLIVDLAGRPKFASQKGIHLSETEAQNVTFFTVIHEAFHLFAQTLKRDGIMWAQYQQNPVTASRTEIIQQCYLGNVEIKSLFESELAVLKSSVAHLVNGDIKNGLDFAKKFREIRSHRYSKLSRVNLGSDAQPASCRFAENYWEREEGTANFVAQMFMETFDVNAFKDHFESTEYYYQFGDYQLRALNILCPDFSTLVRTISTLENTDGIHSEFIKCTDLTR